MIRTCETESLPFTQYKIFSLLFACLTISFTSPNRQKPSFCALPISPSPLSKETHHENVRKKSPLNLKSCENMRWENAFASKCCAIKYHIREVVSVASTCFSFFSTSRLQSEFSFVTNSLSAININCQKLTMKLPAILRMRMERLWGKQGK